jgi:hypothetical protein
MFAYFIFFFSECFIFTRRDFVFIFACEKYQKFDDICTLQYINYATLNITLGTGIHEKQFAIYTNVVFPCCSKKGFDVSYDKLTL